MKETRGGNAKTASVCALTLILLAGWSIPGGLVLESPEVRPLVSADFILWMLGPSEDLIRTQIQESNLGSIAVVTSLAEVQSGRALVTVDALLPTISTGEAGRLRQFLAAGGAVVVLGSGGALQALIGRPAMDLTPTVEYVVQEMRLNIETGEVQIVSTSGPSVEQVEWFQVYGAAASDAGGINQIRHSATLTTASTAIQDALVWSLEPRAER